MNKYGVSENGWTKRYDRSTLKPNNWSKSQLHQYLKVNPVTDANKILVVNTEMESLLQAEIKFIEEAIDYPEAPVVKQIDLLKIRIYECCFDDRLKADF